MLGRDRIEIKELNSGIEAMSEFRDMWRKGGKADKAGLVLACIIASAWGIYLIVHLWQIYFALAVLLVAVLVAGFAYLMLLAVGLAVVMGAIKGIVNEVKKLLKEIKG